MKRQRAEASKRPAKVPSTATSSEPVTRRKRRVRTAGKLSKRNVTVEEKAKTGNDNGTAIHPPEEDAPLLLLTPHTLRLLKLIQDGSREHAAMAALQLTTITAQSSTSPLVLWDVLGRLQAFLVAPSWQTRHNASVAMQGVARQLPPLSRQQFMQGVHVTVTANEKMATAKQQQQQQQQSRSLPNASSSSDNNSDTNQSNNYLWLTLADVQTELDAIVQNGRLLWAYAEQDQDTTTLQAEQCLHHLDQQQLHGNHNNNKQDGSSSGADEFVQQRIQWQRRILAQRVGLSGLVQATATGTSLFDTITAEDLDYAAPHKNSMADPVESKGPPVAKRHSSSNKKKTEKRKPKRRRKRKGSSVDDDEEDMDGTSKEFLNAQSVRALLVLEMQREQQQQQSSSSSSRMPSNKGSSMVSHDNPQTLLATELLYRTFDPSWSIRHGALLGLLSLLRAWHTPNSTITDNSNTFGAWPQDIMARCLCILVLDRFGDYSGTTTTAVGIGGSESGCVVAPVRETAGQLLAMVWLLAPVHIQAGMLQLLYRLARGDTENVSNKGDNNKKNLATESRDRSADWETRHGALLALKYIVAVQITSTSSTDAAGSNQHNMVSHLSGIADVATECLADTSDDVQSVAAQILSTLTTVDSYSMDSATRQEIFNQLWKALARARNMSSSILDLMNLCSTLLHHQDGKSIMLIDQENRGGDIIPGAKILDIFRAYLDHDLTTVRLAALRSISIAVMPLWKSLVNADSVSESLVGALDSLQERLFISYLQDTATVAFENIDEGDKAQEKTRQEASSALDTTPLAIFKSCRSRAWHSLVAVLSCRTEQQQQQQQHSPPLESLSSRLIMMFFGMHLSDQPRETFVNSSQDYFPGLVSASEALSDVIWATVDSTCTENYSRSSDIDILEVAMNTFVHSPWTIQCEAACLFLRSLLKRSGTNERKDGPLLRRLQSCRQSILAALIAGGTEHAPLCLATVHVVGDVSRDPDVLQLRDSAFLNGVKLLHTSSPASKIEDTVANIKGLWKAALISKSGHEAIYTTTTSDIATTNSSMKLFAVMAGASLAGSNGEFPTVKATPIIRPIMTSLKNETDPTRLKQTAEYMVELLLLMFLHGNSDREQALSPFEKAREKILRTMCNHLGSQGVADEPDMATLAFAEVVQKFVNAMSSQIDKLDSLPPFWLLLQPLRDNYRNQNTTEILRCLNLLEVICSGLSKDDRLSSSILSDFLPPVTALACQHEDGCIRAKCTCIIKSMCCTHTDSSLQATLPVITGYLEDRANDSYRISGCHLLEHIVHEVGIAICPFVRRLLRIVMSLMADPTPSCAKTATSIFASLVRVAPLVESEDIVAAENAPPDSGIYEADSVVDHLIHGKPLPPYTLPQKIQIALTRGGITLRPYQMEGIAWLRFLQNVKLNGALCDSMGLVSSSVDFADVTSGIITLALYLI